MDRETDLADTPGFTLSEKDVEKEKRVEGQNASGRFLCSSADTRFSMFFVQEQKIHALFYTLPGRDIPFELRIWRIRKSHKKNP